MLRIFVTSALLFLLPFVLFAIYATVMDYLADPAQSGADGSSPVSTWQKAPIGWMAGLGATLVVVTLIYLALTSSPAGSPGGTYHPPVIKDGKVQPGYVD